MTRVRRINVSQIEGDNANNNNSSEIRPAGETAFYLDTSGNRDKLTLMMFDGERTNLRSKVLQPGVLFGSNADSGDNLNADTIKLIPDAELFANGSNQYLVVDPTGGEPGHIHIRAGGTQDASTADLYLGGELTCVRVSDTSGIVTVRTTNVGDPNVTMNWAFEPDGNLYFPGIGNNRIGESEPGLVVSSDNAVVLQSNNGSESNEWLFNTNGTITFPDNTVQTTAYPGPSLALNTTSTVAVSVANSSTSNLDLTVGQAYILYKIETSHASWVRIYTDSASRTADAAREQGTDPDVGSGVVAEAITTGSEVVIFAPGVNGFNNENPTTSLMPIALTNLSGGENTITVTVTKLTLVP